MKKNNIGIFLRIYMGSFIIVEKCISGKQIEGVVIFSEMSK